MSFEVPDTIAGLRVHPLEIDKHRELVEPGQVDRLRAAIVDDDVTDLLVISHGWNNDKDDALRLYHELIASISEAAGAQAAPGPLDDRRLAVMAVFWPSKRFADEELIPGGAASVDGDVPAHLLLEEIEQLRGFFDHPDAEEVLDELEELVPRLETSTEARTAFADGVRRLLDPDELDPEITEELPPSLFSMPGDELIEELAVPRPEETEAAGAVGGPQGTGGAASGQGGIAASPGGIAAVPTGPVDPAPTGPVDPAPTGPVDPAPTGPVDAAPTGPVDPAAGGAAFVGGLLSGIRAGARNALNLITYYTMKKRAGEAGRERLAPVLRQLRDEVPQLRLHLIGHSFGGRLVAAAALGADGDPPLPVASLTLLQAAFSHHGFAEGYVAGKDGYFHAVVADTRVSGPTVITHTRNDKATTWAYPVASRAARQRAASFGGPDDIYGAIGTNGAISTPRTTSGELLAAGSTYAFEAGGVHNLEASAHITGHSDITGPEVAHAVVAAIAAT